MGIYVIIEAVVGIVAGILLAVRTKRAEGVAYGKLDRVGCVTNIALLLVYAMLSPMYLFIGFLAYPAHDGLLGLVGMIVAIPITAWLA